MKDKLSIDENDATELADNDGKVKFSDDTQKNIALISAIFKSEKDIYQLFELYCQDMFAVYGDAFTWDLAKEQANRFMSKYYSLQRPDSPLPQPVTSYFFQNSKTNSSQVADVTSAESYIQAEVLN